MQIVRNPQSFASDTVSQMIALCVLCLQIEMSLDGCCDDSARAFGQPVRPVCIREKLEAESHYGYCSKGLEKRKRCSHQSGGFAAWHDSGLFTRDVDSAVSMCISAAECESRSEDMRQRTEEAATVENCCRGSEVGERRKAKTEYVSSATYLFATTADIN